VREVHQKRQEWWPTRRRRGCIAGIEYFTRETLFDKKDSATSSYRTAAFAWFGGVVRQSSGG